MIDAFKKRLEDSNKARVMHAIKLRPNCDTAWIERLKGQIQVIGSAQPAKSGAAAAANASKGGTG